MQGQERKGWSDTFSPVLACNVFTGYSQTGELLYNDEGYPADDVVK